MPLFHKLSVYASMARSNKLQVKNGIDLRSSGFSSIFGFFAAGFRPAGVSSSPPFMCSSTGTSLCDVSVCFIWSAIVYRASVVHGIDQSVSDVECNRRGRSARVCSPSCLMKVQISASSHKVKALRNHRAYSSSTSLRGLPPRLSLRRNAVGAFNVENAKPQEAALD